MGRNYKERARYALRHETRPVSYSLKHSILRQLWRRNWDIGDCRNERINKLIKQLRYENINEGISEQ
ncbi:MAG: hypothetical protein ACRC6R_10245 [Bacteroidales bacterium]